MLRVSGSRIFAHNGDLHGKDNKALEISMESGVALRLIGFRVLGREEATDNYNISTIRIVIDNTSVSYCS